MRKRLVLSIVLLSACGPNELGWNREAAQANAVAWAKAVGMPEAKPVCNAVDTEPGEVHFLRQAAIIRQEDCP